VLSWDRLEEVGEGVKTRTVKQYCCDFCKKRGLSASHMATHERHCTMNPNRLCRVCPMAGETQRPMAELKACLPQRPRSHWEQPYDEDTGHDPSMHIGAAVDGGLKKLNELTKCPACTLAAFRQSSIPMWRVSEFDFKAEMKAVWDDINEVNHDGARYCECI
jgi:hypothetical protein